MDQTELRQTLRVNKYIFTETELVASKASEVSLLKWWLHLQL